MYHQKRKNIKLQNARYLIRSEINIIPFLDILLVLLVTFVISSPSGYIQEFNVNLPRSEIGNKIILNNNKTTIIVIEMLETKTYNIVINEKRTNNVSINQLISNIYAQKKANSNLKCLIAASENLKYDEVIQLLNLLKKHNIQSVGLITSMLYH